jgi:DNA-binding transcriptional ArsR family regulator
VRFARLVDANHRTAVRHLTKFTQLGIVEQVRTFGGFHYKLRQAVASDEGRRHVEELEAVRQIFAEDKCDG